MEQTRLPKFRKQPWQTTIVFTLVLIGLTISTARNLTFSHWRAIGPTPSLEEIRALARVRKFDRAQSLLQRYLLVHPENAQARLLIADLTTEGTNSHPELALEHLRAIQPDGFQQAALVKLFEGKAHYQQGRYDLAETCWTESLRLNPLVPEAGWALVDLLDKEGRAHEAHRLGLRLHEVEPDPRDRVRILLEMSRLDIEAPEALSQVQLFEPLVEGHPGNLPITLTLGLALVRVNRGEEGLEVLRDALRRHPNSPEVWDAWLTGLSEAGGYDQLAEEFARLPKSLTADPRFAKHEAMIAQIAKNWAAAVRAYRRAFAFEPYNQGVIYRLRFVLRQAGETAEYQQVDQIYGAYKEAFRQLRGSYFEGADRNEDPHIQEKDFKRTRGAYYEILAIKTLGVKPHPELYQRLADLREQMGRPDEARAWHRLVVRDSPNNPVSLAALERLK
jgi:tetratricopeptide (TPR) repeat protein